jgi:hypothetical protein
MLSPPVMAFVGVITKLIFDGVVNAATLCIVTDIQPILVCTANPVWAVIAVSSVVDLAVNVRAPAVLLFALSPPTHMKLSWTPAAEPAPMRIVMVSARLVVCDVVELITATEAAAAPMHVQLTLLNVIVLFEIS